jgi:hypothetical protein
LISNYWAAVGAFSSPLAIDDIVSDSSRMKSDDEPWLGDGAVPDPRLLGLLVNVSDWIMDHNRSGICLRHNVQRPCAQGVVRPPPAWTGKSDNDGGNYVTGNLARTLLAAGTLTGNCSYLDEGLAWCDTFCAQQKNDTSAAGSPAGYWPAEVYFADTGTGVTALAYAVHLADTPWRKARYMEVLTRYACYVLEGSHNPPGNESAKWGHIIGKDPHPYSWIIPSGPDKGAMGDGYWNGTLNDWPYTIATATTGAAFFAEMFALTKNETYRTVANGAVDWLLKMRGPNGANIYVFDGKAAHPADILTETTTYPTEGFISVDRHIPGAINRLHALESTVKWVITMTRMS